MLHGMAGRIFCAGAFSAISTRASSSVCRLSAVGRISNPSHIDARTDWRPANDSFAHSPQYRKNPRLIAIVFVMAAVVAGCQPGSLPVAPPDTPSVPVAHPIKRDVTDYVDFTGRTDAVHSVNIIARVTGYLVQMPFKEGAEVKAGDLLFEIDPRPYQAQLEQAKSQVTLYEAQLELAKTTLARYRALAASTPGVVSEQALDQDKASVNEAEAARMPSRRAWKFTGSTTSSPGSSRRSTARSVGTT